MSARLQSFSLALAGLGLCCPAFADSSRGVDTVLGSGINPRGQDPTILPGNAAVGTFRPGGSSTPTGLRYEVPPLYPEPNVGVDGWNYNLSLEAGYWGQDADNRNPLFRQYLDWHKGLSLNWFSFDAEKPTNATYLTVFGSNVGRKDQFYGLEFGKYNALTVQVYIDQIPHALGSGSTYFEGGGSDFLSLPSSLTPSASSLAAIDAAAQAGDPYDFNVQRDRAGLRAFLTLASDRKVFVFYTYEHRTGSRQMGGSMFFPIPLAPDVNVGGISEIIEPIDYKTQDLSVGYQYAGELTQFNVTLDASFFRNANRSLTWENPYDVGSLGPPNPYTANLALAQIALAPDNEAYDVKADFARAFPDWHRSHLDGSISLGHMTQNADLLPPSVNTGIGGNPPYTWDNADWNTTDALSRKTSEARIDTLLVNLQFSSAVLDTLTLRAKARYYQTKNDTDYTAYNPLTGEYGYLAEGGGQGAVVPGESGIYFLGAEAIHYRSIPFDGTQQNLGLEADYRLAAKVTLTGSYERETYLRHHRERARTWDDKFKLGIVDRQVGDSSVRASYEYDTRRGSTYNYDPYAEFYTSSLPGAVPNTVPHTLAELGKFDLGDRDQHILNLRYNRTLLQNLDVGVTLQEKLINWGAEFGRIDKQRGSSINLDLDWSPSDGTTAYAYYSYEYSRIAQANVNDNAVNLDGSPDYGGDVYLTDDAWTVVSKDHTEVIGLGVKRTFAKKIVLDLGYTMTRSSTAVTYAYLDPGGAVLGAPGTPLPDIGNAFPDLTYRLNALQGSLVVPCSKTISWRFVARYEHLDIYDWHYVGLTAGALPSNSGGLLPATFIDRGPSAYHSFVLGIMIQYKL